MLNLLYKYLVLNDHLGIPGIGTFTVKQYSSKYDGASGGFTPPGQEIAFESGSALTDKSFYHFLAQENGITEVDAVRRFQDFAYQLRKDIQSHSSISLQGMGVLERNGVGEIVFRSSYHSQKYLSVVTPEVVAERAGDFPSIEQQEAIISEEDIVPKDRWWIWATMLALLALAAIGYFYMQEQ